MGDEMPDYVYNGELGRHKIIAIMGSLDRAFLKGGANDITR